VAGAEKGRPSCDIRRNGTYASECSYRPFGRIVQRARRQIIALVAEHNLPVMCEGREVVEDGGLISWGYHDKKFYLLDVLRKRLNYPELRRAVIDQAQRFGVTNILIEGFGYPAHSGSAGRRSDGRHRLRPSGRHRQADASARPDCAVREWQCPLAATKALGAGLHQ
jgi:hypothetical protein